jgi:cytochrome P450
VSTNPFAASMSTANFKDPFTFRPERWLDENSSDDLDASQPFSYGPRVCMGRRQVELLFQTWWRQD